MQRNKVQKNLNEQKVTMMQDGWSTSQNAPVIMIMNMIRATKTDLKTLFLLSFFKTGFPSRGSRRGTQ
jgi:hypothetical protein